MSVNVITLPKCQKIMKIWPIDYCSFKLHKWIEHRSISPACRAHSSKPAAIVAGWRQCYRHCSAYYASTHTRLTALCPGLQGWAGTRKVKPIWILLEQETVSGSGTRWTICKSAPHSRQITTPAPHHLVFYRPDALPAAQPTASKHWRQSEPSNTTIITQAVSII